MSIFKCKMCGGDLEVRQDQTVAVCDYCGTKQTLPRLDGDRKANLYDRANHFRRNNDFDKAMGIYEQILNEDNTDAEAYWSLVLCRYGIEYVEDPAIHKRIPTVNRAQYTSVFADEDYKSALQYADVVQKEVYEAEAKAIDEIQKGILAISQKEKPFDVFICYKETDNAGRRTPDSVLANDLYHQLTQEGFKVFFSRITLEDKLGSAYEPYIFAALNSAKVMVVLGTKPEYFNAVWVKNEWSRYLTLIKNGAKKTLVPAYKDMDPYDLPEEFSHLQAQDMSKLGFMQDLIRGIRKIAAPEEAQPVKETVVVQQSAASGNVTALLKRGNMALEDGEWAKADEFFEEVLNQDAECAEAYLGKALAAHKCCGVEDLCDSFINGARKLPAYMVQADTENETHIADMVEKCTVRNYLSENEIRNKYKFDLSVSSEVEARSKENDAICTAYSNDRNLTRATQYAQSGLRQKIDGIKAQLEQELARRLAKEKETESARINEKKANYQEFLKEVDVAVEKLAKGAREDQEKHYQEAVEAVRNAKTIDEYSNAKKLLASSKLEEYKDCAEYNTRCDEAIRELKYQDVVRQVQSANTVNAYNTIKETLQADFAGYKDCDNQIALCNAIVAKIEKAEKAAAQRRRRIAAIVGAAVIVVISVVIVITQVVIPNIKYDNALALMEAGKNDEAYNIFRELDDYKDSANKADNIQSTIIKEGLNQINVGDYIKFGRYEQDNDVSNGNEEVEWLVLDIKDGKALVISKYALDCKQFNTSCTEIMWETCTLRNWLNNDFLNTAFVRAERMLIPAVTISENNDLENLTTSETTLQDQLFLLSVNEVNQHFGSTSEKQCEATAYANANGGYVKNATGNCWWWLRSPGFFQDHATGINCYGDVDEHGSDVDFSYGYVRPAMWIDLS